MSVERFSAARLWLPDAQLGTIPPVDNGRHRTAGLSDRLRSLGLKFGLTLDLDRRVDPANAQNVLVTVDAQLAQDASRPDAGADVGREWSGPLPVQTGTEDGFAQPCMTKDEQSLCLGLSGSGDWAASDRQPSPSIDAEEVRTTAELMKPQATITDLAATDALESDLDDMAAEVAFEVESLSTIRVTATHGTSTNPGASDEDN